MAVLDRKFVWVVTSLVKLPFKIIALIWRVGNFLANTLRGKPQSAPLDSGLPQTDVSEHPDFEVRAFSSFGALRWVSDIPPEAMRKQLCDRYPIPQHVEILRADGSKQKLPCFGDVREFELRTLSEIVKKLKGKFTRSWEYVQELDFLPELGALLSADGKPEQWIYAFSMTSAGAVMLRQNLLEQPDRLAVVLSSILTEEDNRHAVTQKSREAQWNFREGLYQRLKDSPDFSQADPRSPCGYFRSRPIIDFDTAVRGGVFLGLPAREALIADDASLVLDAEFAELTAAIRQLKQASGLALEEKVLGLVFERVRAKMSRSSPETLKTFRNDLRLAPDDEVLLSKFVEAEVGGSEQQAFLAAYFLERLGKEMDYYLTGKISLDRNMLPGETHAWVRYTYSAQDIYVVDPYKNFCGRLDDYSLVHWPYERPEDLVKPKKIRPILAMNSLTR